MSRLTTNEFGDPITNEFGDPVEAVTEFGDPLESAPSAFAEQTLKPKVKRGMWDEIPLAELDQMKLAATVNADQVDARQQFKQMILSIGGNLAGRKPEEIDDLMFQEATQPQGSFREDVPPDTTVVEEFLTGARQQAAQAFAPRGVEWFGPEFQFMAERAAQERPARGAGGFAGGVVGSFAGLGNPGKLPENVLSMGLGGGIAKLIKPVVQRVAGIAGAKVAGVLANAVEEGGEEAAFSAVQQAGKEDWANDPVGAAERVVAAAGLGGAVGAVAGGAIKAALPKGSGDTKAVETAQQLGLLSDWEVAVIGNRPEILHDVVKARAKNQYVQIKPRVGTDGKPVLDADGNPVLSYDIRPDPVTQREKALLGQAAPFIDAYRSHLDKGGVRLDEFDSDAPWLALHTSRRAGYLRPATELSERPATQAKIAKAQRKAADELLVLKGPTSFSITDRVKATARADAELASRINELQGRDNDNHTGVRRRVAKAVEVLPEAQQLTTLSQINTKLDEVAQRFPEETQLGTFDRLLEEFDPQADKSTYEFIAALRDKVQAGAEGFKPWGERVRQAQTGLREVLDTLVGPELVVGRERIAALAKELPDSYRADLQQRALEAKTPEEMRAVVDSIAQSQEAFLRESQTQELVKGVGRLPKIPTETGKLIVKRVRELETAKTSIPTYYRGIGPRQNKEPTYLSESKGYASEFGSVSEFSVKPDAKTLDLTGNYAQKFKQAFPDTDPNTLKTREQQAAFFKSKGYDVVKYLDEASDGTAHVTLQIINPEVVSPRAARTPDDAPQRAGTQGATAGPGTAKNAGNAKETAKETKVAAPNAAVRYRGKVTEGDSHHQAMVKLLGETVGEPRAKALLADSTYQPGTPGRKLADELLALDDKDQGFVWKGRYFTREALGEALNLNKNVLSDEARAKAAAAAARAKDWEDRQPFELHGLDPEYENSGLRAALVDLKTGESYIGKVNEPHSHLLARLIKDKPALQYALNNDFLADKNQRFATPDGKILTRAEAATLLTGGEPLPSKRDWLPAAKQQTEALGLKKGATSDEVRAAKPKPAEPDTLGGLLDGVEKPKPLIITDPKTGYTKVDLKELEIQARGLPADQLKLLVDDIRALVRRGQIETGLYKKALKYDLKQDATESKAELDKHTDLTSFGEHQAVARHVAKLVVDPVTVEGHIDQIAGQDSTTYRVIHKDLVPGYDRHQDNQAKRDRWVDGVVSSTLGMDASGPLGKHRLLTYFNQKLPSGISRGRAMGIYALSEDAGRKADLAKHGAEDLKTGEKYDTKAAIAELSAKDKAFVDQLKTHFQTPEMRKSMRVVTLLTSRPVQIVSGWFTSRRKPQTEALSSKGSDFAGFSAGLVREIDPLKDRVENATGAFQVGDFFSDFVHISDKLSMFGEMGKELYRADALIANPEFKSTYIKKFGQPAYQRLQMYLSNIHNQVGHESTALDIAMNRLQSGFSISRTALNLFSAAKQYGHVLTILADGEIRMRDTLVSLVSAKALSKSERADMLANSGLAHQRYEGGHYLRNFLVQANEGNLPSKLSLIQHYSMGLQRTADRQVMTLAWAAAKRTARAEGHTGADLTSRTKELFGIAAGRDQPTDNPLYASELEIQAKRSPLLRGLMSFQREQNRIYNVVRRHVVHAGQDPTAENLSRAGRALLFGVAGNALFVLGVNELRRAAFAKPSDDEDKMADLVGNLAGMYYLGGTVEQVAQGMINTKRRFTQETSGIAQIGVDFAKAALAFNDAAHAEGEISSGMNKGQDRSRKRLIEGFDSLTSGLSSTIGLPLWSIWQQARGLYRWTDDQTRLMTYLERERAELKDAGKETSFRWVEIEAAKDRIAELHGLRQQGVLSRESAQKRIESELRRVLR